MQSVGCFEKADEVLRIIDKIEKIGMETVRKELVDLEITTTDVEKIISFVKLTGSNEQIIEKLKSMEIVSELFAEGVEELDKVVKMAFDFGVPEINLQIDLSIARGLSYYTGTVYETKLVDERISGSVCSGGRYDNLAESYSNQSYPGVGISIGLTRLFSQLLSVGIIEAKSSSVASVLVLPMSENLTYSLDVAKKLREAGIKTELYSEEGKFKKKIVYANKVGVPYVIIIGEDEERQGVVALKNMETGEQQLLQIKEAIGVLKKVA
jgi:histidyl-tRNA synthetase